MKDVEALGGYLRDHVKGWLLRSTVGIYTVDWFGAPSIVGSAVCLECTSGPALITADHVLQGNWKRGMFLRRSDDSLISLNRCRFASLQEHGLDLDLAVMLLTPEIAAGMHPPTYWLGAENILDEDESLEDRQLVVCGFPVERFSWNPARRGGRVRSLMYTTGLYDNRRGAWEDDATFNQKYAIDLDFAPEGSVGITGAKHKHPTPKGLSGGGIWLLPPPGEGDFELKLVAIQHRWHRRLHALRGTRIVGLTEEIEPVRRAAAPLDAEPRGRAAG